MTGTKKGKLISWILFFVLASLLVFWAFFLEPSSLKYFTFVYLSVGVILVMFQIPFVLFKSAWAFFLFILINILVLLVYLLDTPSLVNLAALIVSYGVIYYLVAAGMNYLGDYEFENIVYKIIQYILILSLIVSPILTYLQLPYAPNYYPWEALFSDNRFLLITGNGVGHSIAMWLMAISAAYIIRNIFRQEDRFNKLLGFLLLVLLIWGVIETKSRTALLFVIILLLECAGYGRLLSKRLFALMPIIGLALFFLSIFSSSFRFKVEDTLSDIQSLFPSIRIVESNLSEISLYSGRDILNVVLISEFTEHPWFGSGHSDPVLLYGVNSEGNVVSFDETKSARSESTLRMLTKYGVFYFFGLLLFILTPLIRAFNGYYRDNIFVISISSIIIASSINDVIFENVYGVSALFAVLIIVFLIIPKFDSTNLLLNPQKVEKKVKESN